LDLAYRKLSGARGRLFADPQPAPGEIAFQVDNTSAAYYESAYYKLHRRDLQPVPEPRTAQPRVDLAHVLRAEFLDAITSKGAEPAFIHCAGGNRAATMWLIKRIAVDHWDADRATKEAIALGQTSEELRKFAIEYGEAHKR